ncbi:hypothetical protein Dda_1222 [Drechslerella dactyloides]|uniref:Fucose-specific lectin n=1 Tax=Drechslerella dactyloides TaxID=74499 RepID=A0AAD6J6V6_DREDA|nr:hypothetical protein Dda_1222 [Drechslerella dactyloides]
MATAEEDSVQLCMQLFDPGEKHESWQKHLIVERPNMWPNGSVVTCSFVTARNLKEGQTENPLTPRVRRLIQHYAHEWERFANIKLRFVDDESIGADVRISLIKGGKLIQPPAVLPILGQIFWFTFIGRPSLKITWIKKAVYKAYKESDGWEEPDVNLNFNNFVSVDARTHEYTSWDKRSIMHYPIKPQWNEERIEVGWNYTLSDVDKKFIGEKYPLDQDNSTSSNDHLLERTAYTAVDVYEYQHAKMYMRLFFQAESGSLYQLTSLYRDGNPTVIQDPVCKVEHIPTSDGFEAIPNTGLASVVHYDGPGIPTVHLFYIDRSTHNIREIVWINGVQTAMNNLGIKADERSSLSAIFWKGDKGGKKLPHLRLYYQTPSGAIAELCKIGMDGEWSQGRAIGGTPIPGTSLSFVNRFLDKADIHGFWQSSNGTIRESIGDGTNWTTSPWSIDNAVEFTAIAAATVGDRSNPDIAVYYVDGTDTISRAIAGSSTKAQVDKDVVGEGSRMAVASTHSGFHVITSGVTNCITKRVFPKEGGSPDPAAPAAMKLARDSSLKFGRVFKLVDYGPRFF